jgi:hypothetical protein
MFKYFSLLDYYILLMFDKINREEIKDSLKWWIWWVSIWNSIQEY